MGLDWTEAAAINQAEFWAWDMVWTLEICMALTSEVQKRWKRRGKVTRRL